MDNAIGRNVNDLDQARAGNFQSAAGGVVFRVARDPQALELKPAGERHQQTERAAGVPVSAMGRMHCESDVAGVSFDVRCRPQPGG